MAAPATVQEFVDGLDGPQKEIVEKIRTIVKRALPQAVETVKWGQPVYVYRGRNLITVMVLDDHINFGLFMGARLRSERLEGTGKGLRHVKVYGMKDVDEREFERLTREAAELA